MFHVLSDSVAEFDKRAHGSTMKHIKRGELAEYSVGVPDDPKEQSKIAEVLDTLDAAIRGTEAVVAKLKAMKQGLLHDLLTRGIDANGDLRPPHTEAPHLYKETPLGWLPKEWDVLPLGEITRELAQGWSPDCPSEEALADEWGVLKTTAVVWQGYQAHENKRLTMGLKPRPHLQVEARDILITRAGPSSRVAVVAYVPETRDKLMISDKLYRLRVHQRHNPGYVSLALGSTAVQREISKTISGMAESQTNISQATLKPLPTPLPSQPEQDFIAETITAQSQKITEEEQLLKKLRLQKSGLMDDLLTGRVSVAPLLEEGAGHGA
ncbi:type I restriction enzyme, S subunit [Poseidonocella sedimentorum]|uniref:Type I restriction enzyme, S subunit n=2 Tax=Poseidonocella sedimentorum TaxID=871652 RepID=A0A1I6EL33_9RHOB|nr:type I restriction enzyme, S subunit [Poseidonocella sedimentorum]